MMIYFFLKIEFVIVKIFVELEGNRNKLLFIKRKNYKKFIINGLLEDLQKF